MFLKMGMGVYNVIMSHTEEHVSLGKTVALHERVRFLITGDCLLQFLEQLCW